MLLLMLIHTFPGRRRDLDPPPVLGRRHRPRVRRQLQAGCVLPVLHGAPCARLRHANPGPLRLQRLERRRHDAAPRLRPLQCGPRRQWDRGARGAAQLALWTVRHRASRQPLHSEPRDDFTSAPVHLNRVWQPCFHDFGWPALLVCQ